MLKKVNKNSFIARIPKKTTSSAGLFYLHNIVMVTMKNRINNTKRITKLG